MKPTRKTRKPLDKLSLADISAFPIWEFATDEEGAAGQDETWVRPQAAQEVPLDAYSLSVAAEFEAPTGATFHGIVGVNTSSGYEAVHAAVVTDNDYVFIPWPGYDGAPESMRLAAKQLGLKQSELFPLKYRLAARVQGEAEPREGVYSYAPNDA
jgi:hypothetical protein